MDFQSQNLTVPRGKILFARFKPGTTNPGPFKELGNCPEFTLSREVSKLSHYSSQRGIKTLDSEITTDSKLSGSLTTDDMRATNLNLWMMGAQSTITQSVIAITTQTEMVMNGDIVQLGRSADNPSGHRKVKVSSVAGKSPDVTLKEGNDYIVHEEIGLVEFLSEGSLKSAATITITYTASAATSQRLTLGETSAEGELKFIAFNPVGENNDITIPRAQLSPNGDISMLSDPESPAWQTMGLTITALTKGNLALAYRDGRPV